MLENNALEKNIFYPIRFKNFNICFRFN